MFWIVIPGYNTAQYVRETIESVLHQTIGFKEHIKMVLIDDCSTDNTLEIYNEFKAQYPDNIIVEHFEKNRGVSAARNYAVNLCKEQEDAIVGFLDSDDLLEEDAIEKVAKFFEEEPDVNIAAIEIKYFGAREDEHRLNWKFDERKVVDINKDFNFPQFYIGGSFLKGKALKRLKFDESMSFWEDALAINKCIIHEGKYGLVKGAFYLYRKREDESSLVDKAWHDKNRYVPFIDKGYMAIIKYCISKKMRVIPYVQYLVAYHMRLFMGKERGEVINETLTEEEMLTFRKKLHKVLIFISSKTIAVVPASIPILEEMMSLKRWKKVRTRKTFIEDDCIISFRGVELARISQRRVRIYDEVSDVEGFEGMWHGVFASPVYQMQEDDYIFMEHDGVRKETIRHPSGRRLNILGERLRNYRFAGFAFEVPEDWDRIQFWINAKGVDIKLNEVYFENGRWNWEGDGPVETFDR